MSSTDKDIGKIKTYRPSNPVKWSMLIFISAFLLSALILACSHMPPQEGRGTAQTLPVPENEKNLSKETKINGATASSPAETPKPAAKPAQPPPVKAQEPPKPVSPTVEARQKSGPSPSPLSTSSSPLRVTEVAWETVNLREGPGMNHKVIGSAKKGTRLRVFEEKGSWLRVSLEDGKEVWVSKSATPEAPTTSSPPTPSPSPSPSSSTLKRAPSKPASPM